MLMPFKRAASSILTRSRMASTEAGLGLFANGCIAAYNLAAAGRELGDDDSPQPMLFRMLAFAMCIRSSGRSEYLSLLRKVHSSRVKSRDPSMDRSSDILIPCGVIFL